MRSLVQYYHEEQKRIIIDIPGAYLNADIPKDKVILSNLENDFVEMFFDIFPTHKPKLWYENGKKVIYLILINVLYSCMESKMYGMIFISPK